MNNILIILAAIFVLFISFVQCYNDEDMALFILGSLVSVVGIVVGVIGIIFNKNFFEF